MLCKTIYDIYTTILGLILSIQCKKKPSVFICNYIMISQQTNNWLNLNSTSCEININNLSNRNDRLIFYELYVCWYCQYVVRNLKVRAASVYAK